SVPHMISMLICVSLFIRRLFSRLRSSSASGSWPMRSATCGKLEGPTTITDASKFPRSFKEAPQLAELVKAGKPEDLRGECGDAGHRAPGNVAPFPLTRRR